jgi:hypothetical protein
MIESWSNLGRKMAFAASQLRRLDLEKQEVKYDAGFAPAKMLQGQRH